MKKEDLKKQIFTIPNIITYLRILAIPFFVYFTLATETFVWKSTTYPLGFPFIGFLIMVVAASSDLVDGWIARKFNQVSDLGKLLDPLADKLMHVSAILSLVIIGYVHWAFVLLLFVKETLMIVGAAVLAKYNQVVQAKIMGKVASAILSLGIFMAYFHPVFAQKVFYLDWIIISIGLLVTYVAFFDYLKQGIAIVKAVKQEKTGLTQEVNNNIEENSHKQEKNTQDK